MPLYYFDTQDGDRDTDHSGVELADEREAIAEAVRYAGAMIKDKPDIVKVKREFMVRVRREKETIARVRIILDEP